MRTCLSVGAALWLAASAGWAVDWKSLRPEGCVSDFAGVMDSASRQHLEAYGAELKGKTGAPIALVTIPSLEGEPLDDVTKAIARAWGVGYKEGVLVLVVVRDRRSRVEVGENLKAILPLSWDWDRSVRREMSPGLRAHQYGDAMMAAAETFGTAVSRARHVSLSASLPRHLHPSLASSFPGPLVLMALSELVLFVCLAVLVLRRRTARAGGGFGNFDSTDSFGGFGGGDPSGHGASRGW